MKKEASGLMKINRILLISLIVFLIQGTILQNIRIADIIPNLSIITLVLFVIYYDNKSVLVLALSLGVLQDLFISPLLGINIFLYVLIALLIINFESVFNKGNFISPIFLISISTGFYHVLYFVILKILNLNFSLYKLFDVAIIELALNIIIGLLLYRLTKRKLLDR